ncbi:MAG: SCO family protein [Niabella sp.]
MKKVVIVLTLIIFCTACKSKQQNATLPSDSIFYLTSDWQNQNNQTIKLSNLNGKTLVMVMIYTSCKAACPILVSKMKQIESKIATSNMSKVSMVLVSIDPETDTPERLKEFSISNGMNNPHWIFLRGNEASTQELANVLSMKYKQISPIDFSHSNIITIFSPDGQMQSQEEGLDINVKAVAEKVNHVVKEYN